MYIFAADGVFDLLIADERLNEFAIVVTDDPPPAQYEKDQICAYQIKAFEGQMEFQCQDGVKAGRYVVIWLKDLGMNRYLSLCEVFITQNSE